MALLAGVIFIALIALPVFLAYQIVPRIFCLLGSAIGWQIQKRTRERRQTVVENARVEEEQFTETKSSAGADDNEWEKVDRSRNQPEARANHPGEGDDNWDGIIGFFHPFCNAGGGGERVLWAAIRATQNRWPNAICVVYTGDHEVSKDDILLRVNERFNIDLHPPTIVFVYLSSRHYVLASTWPHFTLLGQSLGSLVLAYDAFSLLVPDIFIDTMGYAFALALSKFLFPKVPTSAYVHYPTISTDMLDSLTADAGSGQGINAGTGKGWKGYAKRRYWQLFAQLYGWVGSGIDVVMTNSSWTQGHIQQLWGPGRTKRNQPSSSEVVYPPTAVEELEREVDVSESSEKRRQPTIIYISQFRPEKNHQLVLSAFAKFLDKSNSAGKARDPPPRLILLGSVRNDADETYIYSLRLLAHELHITEDASFVLNAPWSTILSHLRTASVGVNAMWNEHFGIGVVEYQAAGLISIVNNSGGPMMDIVVPENDGPTGYYASTEDEYAEAFATALSLEPKEALAMRLRARRRAKKFDEKSFEARWIKQVERLVKLTYK